MLRVQHRSERSTDQPHGIADYGDASDVEAYLSSMSEAIRRPNRLTYCQLFGIGPLCIMMGRKPRAPFSALVDQSRT